MELGAILVQWEKKVLIAGGYQRRKDPRSSNRPISGWSFIYLYIMLPFSGESFKSYC